MDNCWSVASPESVLLQQAPSPAHQRSTPPSCRPATQHAAATRGVVRLCKQKVWGVVAASRLSCLQRRAARMRCLSSNAAGRQLQHAPPRAASRAAPPRAASRAAPPPRRRALGARAIFIDRRQHLEAAWQRQQEREGAWAACGGQPGATRTALDVAHHTPPPAAAAERRAVLLQQGAVYGRVLEVADLEHLEHMLDSAGSSLVVVALYTRSCGACKALLAEFAELCAEVRRRRGRGGAACQSLPPACQPHWSAPAAGSADAAAKLQAAVDVLAPRSRCRPRHSRCAPSSRSTTCSTSLTTGAT